MTSAAMVMRVVMVMYQWLLWYLQNKSGGRGVISTILYNIKKGRTFFRLHGIALLEIEHAGPNTMKMKMVHTCLLWVEVMGTLG